MVNSDQEVMMKKCELKIVDATLRFLLAPPRRPSSTGDGFSTR
jgi:hypothetical protein